ncbi:MAG: hypothetical protein KY475_17210 [Planctomycetes bacterium]|nr:hypothetical protein [Planctomycetota bacterium]
MARKTVDRKELRKQAEAAEAAAPAEKKKKAKKKTPAKRKSRAKTAEPARKKLCWGVFSPSLKRVALFEFHEQDEALKKAEDLSKSGKSPHFVQRVKEEIVEE